MSGSRTRLVMRIWYTDLRMTSQLISIWRSQAGLPGALLHRKEDTR